MATRKTTRTARKAVKKTSTRKAAARKAPVKKAVKKAPARKAAAKAAKRPAAAKATRKTTTARKAVKKTAGKPVAKKTAKTTAKKAVVKKIVKPAKKVVKQAARQAVPSTPIEKTPRRTSPVATSPKAGTVAVTDKSPRRGAMRAGTLPAIQPPESASANAPPSAATPRGRGASRSRKPHHITPEEALANTRELLEAKHARDREPPPWRQFDSGHGQTPHDQVTPPRNAEQEAEAAAHAEQLHRGESRLDAIQGSISERDRHQQGKHDAKG